MQLTSLVATNTALVLSFPLFLFDWMLRDILCLYNQISFAQFSYLTVPLKSSASSLPLWPWLVFLTSKSVRIRLALSKSFLSNFCGTGLQDANEALNISLVAPSKSGLKTIAAFNPKFTYPIFGDDEKIFGYKDLKINLRYRANDMRPHLRVAYSKKFTPVGEQEPTDIVEILEEGGHLPKGLRYSTLNTLPLTSSF